MVPYPCFAGYPCGTPPAGFVAHLCEPAAVGMVKVPMYPRHMSRIWPTLEATSTWRDASVEERSHGVENACRAAMQLLADAPDRHERLRRMDPVPSSTRAHLHRLAAAGHG